MSDTPTAPQDGEIRTGVYVCHCGGNISEIVDVAAVAGDLAGCPNVAIARDFPFMCSDPGQNLVIDDIRNNNINRVVIAACSPALHEQTFRKTLERAGLNPYLYEHVNIREQVSWVHKGDHPAATSKATRLTRAGASKIGLQVPLDPIRTPAERHVVVIGGGIAGIRSALSLAQVGIGVTLVEKGTTLGGRTLEHTSVFPTGEAGTDLVHELAEAAGAHPRVQVRLNARVQSIQGFVGSFTVTLADGTAIQAGAIIIATGFDHYTPGQGEFGYGHPDVMTLPQFTAALDKAEGSELTIGGRRVRHLAFIHCVGSRQVEGVHEPQADGKVNDYCSRVCCAATLHTINRAKARFAGLHVYDLYRDIRTYGRGQEQMYKDASQNGALFFRYTEEALPEFDEKPCGTGRHTLTVQDVLTWNEQVSIPVDLVVLATGTVPHPITELTSMLKLPVGADRFLQEVHPKLRPVELANNGIIVAGSAQGPMDIGEACAAAEAAAAKAAILLSKPTIELDPFVADVDADRCTGCDLCLSECSYPGAITMVAHGDASKARVNPAICVGCGACAAVCEPRAINVNGWTLDQFDAMIDAITAEPALV